MGAAANLPTHSQGPYAIHLNLAWSFFFHDKWEGKAKFEQVALWPYD